MQRLRIWRRALLLAAPLALLACSDDENPIGPENTLIVLNLPDRFSFSIMALDNVTDSERYLWANTQTSATIDVTQAITGGTATLQIRDGDGTVVYSDNVANDNDATTGTAASGLWQIDVVLTKVTGEFSFTVD